MNFRIAGIIAIIGAPFLFVDFLMYNMDGANKATSLSGVFNFIYISAWICSTIGLRRARSTGYHKWGRTVIMIQLIFLSLANCWNIYVIVDPGAETTLYRILDLFWPISNLWMLATGITIVKAKVLRGWMRYVPLIVGLWLPLNIAFMSAMMDQSNLGTIVGGLYSVLAWSLMGLVILKQEKLSWE